MLDLKKRDHPSKTRCNDVHIFTIVIRIYDCLLDISCCEQDFQSRPNVTSSLRNLATIHAVWKADIGNEKVMAASDYLSPYGIWSALPKRQLTGALP